MALAAPVEGPLETVVFQAGDTIRGVAERYLKDPDLWPQILELSGIASPAALQPGAELMVPVQQVASADEALAVSLTAIQKATAEGARIFAPVEIGSAIENRDTAVERRDVGAWAEVVTYAGVATEFAGQALEISISQRDRAAEAVVSDAQGSVEGRAPDQPRWSRRAANDILVEFERVRTLSSSTAQVTFRDLSRLRLNPNSNAIIQRMRSDPLTGGEVTKVSLVNGDFYALLNQLGDRTAFEVEVPGLDTQTQSADFWVKHDGEESRFANYDAPALEIARGSEVISLGENEGAVVPQDGAAERTRVLARAELESPFDGALIYDPAVTLAWRPSEGAEAYWLEVAADADFNTMQASEWGVREVSHSVADLAPGEYFWRVSSLDRLGLPGVRSLSRRFRLVDDSTPPFLTLDSPEEGGIVTTAEVALTGESEPGTRLSVNGGPVPVGDNGRFSTWLQAALGENSVRVEAADLAGNRTERSRTFIYRPAESVGVEIDPAAPRDAEGRLLTPADAIDVAGTSNAEAGAQIRVSTAAGAPAVQALVGERGAVPLHRPGFGGGHRLPARDPRPGRRGRGRARLRRPPGRESRPRSPSTCRRRRTANAWLDVAGGAGDAVGVTVNGAPARIVGRPLRRRRRPWCRGRTPSRSSPPTPSATSRSGASRPSTTSTRRRSCRPGRAGPTARPVRSRSWSRPATARGCGRRRRTS